MLLDLIFKPILLDILFGDDGASSTKSNGDVARTSNGLHAAEDGMLSFITVLVVLFFTVLIGLVANIAYVTREKVEVQNAADSVAFSSALWQARGMNAIAATNHIMGELTAICVLHYALGGPELDEGRMKEPKKVKHMKDSLTAEFNKVQALNPRAIPDRSQIRRVIDHQHRAGATIYDARLTLQYWMWWSLAINEVSGVIKKIGEAIPIVAPITEPISLALDLFAGGLRLKVHQEWIVMEGIEGFAKGFKSVRQPIEKVVIPLIGAYATTVQIQTPNAIQKTAEELGKKNGVEAILYPTPVPLPPQVARFAPAINLPVEKEKEPEKGNGGLMKSSRSKQSIVSDIVDTMLAAVRAIQDVVQPVNDALRLIPGVSFVIPIPPEAPNEEYYPDNPTVKSLPGIGQAKKAGQPGPADWDKEIDSQWMRSTYPWVNAWRTPVRGPLEWLTTLSMSTKFYHHWTNRCCLSKCYELHAKKGLTAPEMYVMRFTNEDGRGEERWTKTSGVLHMDNMFTLVAVVHRPYKTLASPGVFGPTNKDGLLAYSQAMYYNANSQNPDNDGRAAGFVAEVGWDTLNWESPVDQSFAHKYPNGGREPGSFSEFGKLLSQPSSLPYRPKIKLNWQAKLTPVTRLREMNLNAAFFSTIPEKHRKILRRTIISTLFQTH